MNSEKYVYAEQWINWNSEISMQKYHSFITLFARSTIYLVPLFVLLDGSWITLPRQEWRRNKTPTWWISLKISLSKTRAQLFFCCLILRYRVEKLKIPLLIAFFIYCSKIEDTNWRSIREPAWRIYNAGIQDQVDDFGERKGRKIEKSEGRFPFGAEFRVRSDRYQGAMLEGRNAAWRNC